MNKKVISLMLVMTIIISMMPVSAFATEFTDMPNDWSTAALGKTIANGLLNGSNGKIMPNENLTRAQMAAVVNRAFGTTGKASITSFSDVSPSAWYYDDMAKAVHMQTFKGNGNELNPDNNISREEAFVVLARAFNLNGAPEGVLSKFTDANLVSQWAKEGVASLVSAGYVAGANGKLNPKQNITRAEFAQIMDNLVKTYINKEGTFTTVDGGNVMVNVPGVTLTDLTVNGDLIIGDGVGDGDVTLNNITVTGRTIIRGGGENSIRITGNSNIQNIIIARINGVVRVYAEDGTEVGEVTVDGNDDVIIEGKIGSLTILTSDIKVSANNAEIESATILGENSELIIGEKSKVNNLTLNAKQAKVEVLGEVENINTTNQAEGASINVAKGGTVVEIEVNGQGTTIEGKGTVENVEAKADNIEVNTPDTKVTAAKGTTGVTAGGKDVEAGTSTDDKEEPKSSGGGSGGGSSEEPIEVVEVSAITETVTIGINEAYNLVDNLEISTLGAVVTYISNDVTGGYSNLIAGKLTGKKQGRVTITAVASKEGYISKTVSFEVLVAPVLLKWTDPSGERTTGEGKTIVIDISLLEGVTQIDGVDIIMEWHKKVESSSDWQVVDGNDITLKDANGVPKLIESGFYRLAEGITIDSDNPSITSSVTFNDAGEYILTVYAIKE